MDHNQLGLGAGLRLQISRNYTNPYNLPMPTQHALVVTVCNLAAAKSCPVVFGDFMRANGGCLTV